VSGGDPPSIVDLTHDQLVRFHKDHYNPSNALFYTYGNLSLEETLGYLDNRLSPSSKMIPKSIQIPKLPSSMPETIEISCPFDPSILSRESSCMSD
jgi:Zn-dependent M16 (insulinase) family peptidase